MIKNIMEHLDEVVEDFERIMEYEDEINFNYNSPDQDIIGMLHKHWSAKYENFHYYAKNILKEELEDFRHLFDSLDWDDISLRNRDWRYCISRVSKFVEEYYA